MDVDMIALSAIYIFLILYFLKQIIQSYINHPSQPPSPAAPPPPRQQRHRARTATRASVLSHAVVIDIGSAAPNVPRPAVAQLLRDSQLRTPASGFRTKPGDRLSNMTECVICLSDLREEVDTIVVLGCNHMFHKTCISIWTDTTPIPTCPICRTGILKN